MRKLIAAVLLALPAALPAETVDQVATRYRLAGEVLVAKRDAVLLDKGYGPVDPRGGALHKAGARWRLASITKQVTAALFLRDTPDMPAALDTPMTLPSLSGPALSGSMLNGVTPRQLLTHHSGLANPDTTPATADGVPEFYTRARPDLRHCLSQRATPGAPFSYNNCDYLIVGEMLGPRPRWPAGMAMATPGTRLVPGFVGGKPEPKVNLWTYGPAGGLTASARDLLRFDRSLMTGKLLPPASLAELWKPEGNRSYQALGQWVFPGTLKGCAKPKRIVQRDGEIYGVQTRNYILPDDDLAVIVFTNRGSDDFEIGEVWQSKGFAYDLLSAVACP